jgi:hypothetical protein
LPVHEKPRRLCGRERVLLVCHGRCSLMSSIMVRSCFLATHRAAASPTPGRSGQTGNRTLHVVLHKQDSLIAGPHHGKRPETSNSSPLSGNRASLLPYSIPSLQAWSWRPRFPTRPHPSLLDRAPCLNTPSLSALPSRDNCVNDHHS